MVRRLLVSLLVGMALVGTAEAGDPPALVKARAFYNAGDFDSAIETVSPLGEHAATADAARLLIGRSRIEIYRRDQDPSALEAARVSLSLVFPPKLVPRDQVELLIGMGQILFYGDVFGGAADLFDTALGREELLSPKDRLALLDWWATALDRQAQLLAPDRRAPIYERIVTRMESLLRQDPTNPPANYWLIVGARGAGDIVRAWDAAVAGWVRASLIPASTVAIRADIDRVVTEALVIELGRSRGGPDPADAIAATRADWELVKSQWK